MVGICTQQGLSDGGPMIGLHGVGQQRTKREGLPETGCQSTLPCLSSSAGRNASDRFCGCVSFVQAQSVAAPTPLDLTGTAPMSVQAQPPLS